MLNPMAGENHGRISQVWERSFNPLLETVWTVEGRDRVASKDASFNINKKLRSMAGVSQRAVG